MTFSFNKLQFVVGLIKALLVWALLLFATDALASFGGYVLVWAIMHAAAIEVNNGE